MTLQDIEDVEVIIFWGQTVYKVTLVDGTISYVPNDPANSDYAPVQEWLELNT
jgi:hypothetical protein